MDFQSHLETTTPEMDSIDNNAELDSSTSESEDHAKDPEALRRLAENCQALFKDCQRHPVLSESDWIDKMSADFNWWSLGINATKSGHSSLDYRVQARDDVRNVLISLLDSLVVSLKNCLNIARIQKVDLDKTQHKISRDDGEQELESEIETTQSQPSNEEDSELDEQIYYIKTTLQFLSEISAAMRKSGTKFRHQRIDKHFDERSLELEDFRNYLTHIILMSPSKMHLLDEVLYRHTRTEEFIWKRVWMTLRAYFTDAQRLSPVQERLIRANLVRRNRFDVYFSKYCRKMKADKGSKGTLTIKLTAQTTTAVLNPIIENRPASIQAQDPVLEAKLKNTHRLPERLAPDNRSGVSSQQTATEIGSFVIPQRPRTRGTRSVSTKFSQGVLKQDYPKCPNAEGESFWCPFCAQALDSSYANQEKNKKWRGHVAEDLSPYVCIYADCDKPDDMYISTDEWRKHLKDYHRVPRWICDTCWFESDNPIEFEFGLEEEWYDHMMTEHSGEYDDGDLPELVEASRRAIVPPVSCPLCFENTPLLQPETDDHIAEHLHSFALQALPWETVGPDDDTQASVGSNIRKTVPSDDSHELLDEEGNWNEIHHLPDLISAILTRCTNLAKREKVDGLPTLNLKLTDLTKTLQGLSQRFIFYDSEVSPEIAICLTHLELTLQRFTVSGDDLIDPWTLEGLEADIVAELASLNTLVKLGEKRATPPQGQHIIRVIFTGGVTKFVDIVGYNTCEDVIHVTMRNFGLHIENERDYCFWVLTGIDADPSQCRRLGYSELWRIIKNQSRPERNRLILRRVSAGEPGDAELQRAAAIALEEEEQKHARELERVDKRRQIKIQKILGENIVDLPGPDTEALPSNSVKDPSLESTNKTGLSSDLWYQAFQELDEKTREWILGPSESKAENVRQWVTDLVTLIQEREEEYKDSSPKLNVRGCEIIWRDYASKAETLLATIGNIAVNFAFSPSPIICSALGVLMETKVAQYEDLAAVFVCVEKVLSLMRRGTVYEIVYLQDVSSNVATRELQKTLVDLYKTLLQLLSHAPAQLIEGRGRQFLQALVWLGEGTELVSVLSTHEDKLSMAAQACGAVSLTEHQNLLQSLSAPLRRVNQIAEYLVVHLQKKSLDKALDYISNIPISEYHSARKGRTPGTCEWLLKHHIFIKWEESSYSWILWLQGKIGSGKSYLTSKVIDRYWLGNEKDAKHDEGFAYFYCSRFDPARRDLTSIYQSYIRQLAQMNRYPTGMHISIFNLYCKAKREQRRLSIIECRTALSELLNSYPKTTLVLDALDECDVEARNVLMLDLHSLVTAAKRPVKVYIANRREVDIPRNLRHGNMISLDSTHSKGDIEKYIEQEMRLFSDGWESVSEGVRAKVSRTITDQSNGIFIWAYLQLEQIKKLKTDNSILERLEKLPKSLDQAYDEIYYQNDEAELVILQRAVKWVLCAQEPLSSGQLLSAVRLETQRDSKTEAALATSSPITESTLGSICRNFIVKESRLKVWEIFHASAAEYFERKHDDWPGNGSDDVAISLILCLIDCYSRWITRPTRAHFKSWLEHKPDPDDYLDLRHPLQSYARRCWVQHARSSSRHSRLSPVLRRFLGAEGPQGSSSRQYQLWCCHIKHNPHTMTALTATDLFPVQKSIFGICALGLHTLLEGWWEEDINVSLVNSSGMDLLSIAAKYGHHKLCSALIDFGSDMNGILNSVHGSALSEAIDMNHVDIAALLLDRGHNPNTYSDGKILLCIVVERAEWAVPMLLKAKADPNIPCQSCVYGGALEAAVRWGKVDIAKMLIQSGADVNLSAGMGDYGNPLAAAAYGGSLECAGLLIKHGADVNAQLKHGHYGSALVAAVASGISVDCVKFLLEHGADVNAVLEHGNFGSALAAAASESSLEYLELLIFHGADANALLKCGDFGSAMAAAAASKESPECLKSLLEHGADANALLEHGDFGSALAAAASRKSLECVKLLLEHGANVNAQLKCGDFGTALAAAVFGWSEDIEIVKYLVEEAGADTGMLLSNKRWVAMCKHYHHSEDADFVRKVRYLVEGGFVEENVLADLHVSEQ